MAMNIYQLPPPKQAMMDQDSSMAEAPLADHPIMDNTNLDANIDASLDVDDLFGEAADGLTAEALGVSLPSPPLPPSLIMRMMDMQTRGCCTKLSWANTGSIAQIIDDGRKIAFRAMIRDQKTGRWSLTEESMYPLQAPQGTTFEHIQFSGVGIDLAAVDSHGNVHVYTLVGALGRMPQAPTNISPGDGARSDLDAIVGLHWLPVFPTEFRVPYITAALKINGKWETDMRLRNQNDPAVHHVVDGRHSLLYVSRDAKLTLMYQNELVWWATSTKLENITSSKELLSHAAACEDGDHLLLVTHDVTNRLRLYRISITWNPTKHTRPGGQEVTTVAPAFEIGHLTVLQHVAPQQADTAKLSELKLIPAIPRIAVADAGSLSYPTILAVFTRASLPTDQIQQHQEAFSVISRWHVESAVPTLHESFAKLKTNGTIQTQSAVTVLRRQEDNITNKIVLAVEQHCYSTILAFSASDGTIEFRDRITMASIEPYGDTTAVSSLPQAGFEQMMTEHSTHIATCADGSILARIKTNGTLTFKTMALRYSWHPLEDGISDMSGLIEAAIVCLARQYCILSCNNAANDETLALLPHDLSTDLRVLFVQEIIRMINRQLDISMQDLNRQQMIVVKEPLIPRAMSAQFVTGTYPGTMERNFAGKFAFTFLNMRLTCTALGQLMQRAPESLQRTDLLASIRGLVKWGSDTLVYVANYLISFKHHFERTKSASGDSAIQAFGKNITETQSPVLHILLCTFTRSYLRFLSSFIPKYLSGVGKFSGTSKSVQEKQQLDETFQHGTNLPFKFQTFEHFIIEVDTAIRKAYTSGSVPSERRANIELSTMTEPRIPEEMQPVIQNLLESALPTLMEHVDMAALYFRDTTWIGIEGGGGERNYDIIRKLPLTKGMKLRKCRRCPAVMEDLTPEKAREMPSWLGLAQRHCVCGNYWIVG